MSLPELAAGGLGQLFRGLYSYLLVEARWTGVRTG